MITEFFAVTGYLGNPKNQGVSMYKITHQEEGEEEKLMVEKVGLRGNSFMPKGTMWQKVSTVAITLRQGLREYERSGAQRYNEVSSIKHGATSSPVIGLFFDEENALNCFNSPSLKTWDPKFREYTEEVILEIGTGAEKKINLDDKLAKIVEEKRFDKLFK